VTGRLPPAAIEIRGLCTRYGATEVLHGINLTVHPGETLGLVGLNGAGKTTLLKSILMLAAPSAGSVTLFGAAHDAPGSLSAGALPAAWAPHRP
jgi:ABC-type multidrug transport system ATPase subunit